MSDELDALLRDHYRAAADRVHADAETVRRFQEAGRAVPPSRGVRRWTIPTLAAAVTAAVLVAVAFLLWPGRGTERQEPPNPVAPPASTAPEVPLPPQPSSPPKPSRTPEQTPTPDPPPQTLGPTPGPGPSTQEPPPVTPPSRASPSTRTTPSQTPSIP
ncbi:hypothetical protein AGRA3207_002597 [Actinomadura graeca]|uniref:Uncharacterized protein n=1 Tax=Actinomadura graeca TaxID=2750812 RepID=A0ABX8QSB5_9ACTN|nr:hypothetical protein [Actinomadura graeca]QXJ21715.1 hypothetical protein AGRA3207_002597 [Actinomadura graeca]